MVYRPLLLLPLFAAQFARSINNQNVTDDAPSINKFPFSLHSSTEFAATIKRGQLNVHYATFKIANVLDLLRIRVRLPGITNGSLGTRPLLQITCQHSTDAAAFALPTEIGEMEDGVLLAAQDKETIVGSSATNRSVYLTVLVTTNSESDMKYILLVKLYDRAQYDVVLNTSNFERTIANQKISAVMPIAFRVKVPGTSVGSRTLRISVNSNDDICAVAVVQNSSSAFLHSLVLAVKSASHITFTRKASLMVETADSPINVFLMAMNDDRICNPTARKRSFAFLLAGKIHRERIHKKEFSITFNSNHSTSAFPMVVVAVAYFALAVTVLGTDQLLPHLLKENRASTPPLITLPSESDSEHSPVCTRQEITEPTDSNGLLVDIELDDGHQQPASDLLERDSPYLRCTEQRSVSTDTDFFVVMHNSDMNWYALIPYFAVLPIVLQLSFVLLMDQLTLMQNNLDACYYNMECSITVGPFRTFNHMYSNIGYLVLGFVFIVLISRRYKYWKQNHWPEYSYCLFILFTVGLMMCLEAFASAFYHVCPNRRTFHIDTLFVEISLALLMVRFYFTRRGGISSSGILQAVAFVVSFHLITDMLKDSTVGLGIILILGISLLVVLQCTLLFGSEFFSASISTRNWRNRFVYFWRLRTKNETVKNLILKKLLLLACITVCNIILAIMFETGRVQTSHFMLYIIILNTAAYLTYYIFCKIMHGESVPIYASVYILISILLWSAAFYFFARSGNDWTKTAAQNRALGEQCKLFSYYDYHDIWHFISSVASFFSLLTVAVLDDDVMACEFHPQRISVF